jgi:hypothetical protein
MSYLLTGVIILVCTDDLRVEVGIAEQGSILELDVGNNVFTRGKGHLDKPGKFVV